jgi:hypothetical protein
MKPDKFEIKELFNVFLSVAYLCSYGTTGDSTQWLSATEIVKFKETATIY